MTDAKMEEVIINKRNCMALLHKWQWICNVEVVERYAFGEVRYHKGKFKCLVCGKTKLSLWHYE